MVWGQSVLLPKKRLNLVTNKIGIRYLLYDTSKEVVSIVQIFSTNLVKFKSSQEFHIKNHNGICFRKNLSLSNIYYNDVFTCTFFFKNGIMPLHAVELT